MKPNTQETKRPAANAAEGTPANPHGRQLPFVATKAELAEIFRCSIKHIEHLTARGLLNPIRLGRSVRYRRDSVIRALEQMEVTKTPSQLAAALGRLSKGKKKTLSKAEIARRTKRLAEARKLRWLK